VSAQLIEHAAADGVQLFLDSGRIGYRGKPEALRRWLPRIKERRDEIMAALSGATVEPVVWWRFVAHFPSRTVEVDLAGGATEAEGRERIRELYPEATMICPLLAHPTEPKPGKLRVALRVAGLSVDLDVRADQADAMGREARRRGLVRYRLRGDDGSPLPGFSLESPGPGEDRAQCLERLRREFGTRLLLDGDEAEGPLK